MNMLSSRALLKRKYEGDGEQVVQDYLNLRFSKHISLMQRYMNLQADSKVLDVGCGTGALLVELAALGAKAVGIDTFEEAGGIDRQIAEARLREAGLEVPLYQGTATRLPFSDGEFDIVVSIGMLEHIPPETRKRVLPEMLRVVKPSGYLFLIAGPTNLTPIDQHMPGHFAINWRSRARKVEISARSDRRQFLEVPWGISRAELRDALPGARFRNLYGEYFATEIAGDAGPFTFRPMGALRWAKRRYGLERLFGWAARLLYAIHQEHCHILAIGKR